MALLAHQNLIPDASLLAALGQTATLENLRLWQTPQPAASVIPADGQIEIIATFAAAGVRLAAVIAHSIPAGALLRFEYRLNGQQLLTTQEEYWVGGQPYYVDGQPYTVMVESPAQAAGARKIICSVLSTVMTCDEIRLHIAGAGGGAVQIGHLWAGDAIEVDMAPGWPVQTADFGRIELVGGTPWAARGNLAQGAAATFSRLSEDRAIGTDGGANLKTIFGEIGTTRPVLLVPRTQRQASIDSTVVWGIPSAPGRVQHERGPHWRGELDLSGLPLG